MARPQSVEKHFPLGKREQTRLKRVSARFSPNDQAQRPPPETPRRLQQSLPNYLNRSTAQGGGSLQRHH
jgi:hypothetical protein